MNHRLSIIIPTYQHANTLPGCLDSIFAQTRVPDEVIVVDDGSKDATQEILKQYEGKIQSIRQENAGAPVARNNGFARSTGDLVLFCDADIVMRPEMLQRMEQALTAHPEASYAYSGFLWGWKTFSSHPFDSTHLKQENYIHTSALIRRVDFPGFDETLKRFQDWDLWLTMLEQGKQGIHVSHVLYQVKKDTATHHISFWIPSPLVHFPWHWIGWKPKAVQHYDEARQIVLKKHHLV